jgi:hypothetical protein
VEDEYLKWHFIRPGDANQFLRIFTGLGFTRCAHQTDNTLYFRKERESDEAWVDDIGHGKVAVNWPYHLSLGEFAVRKALHPRTTEVIPFALYDIEFPMTKFELKALLAEWQEVRRQESGKVFLEMQASRSP